jgi:hypothetical protein
LGRSYGISSHVDQDLTIDCAYFSRGGDRLLVIQSGNHGSEASAGAAVQALVMHRYLSRLLGNGIDVYFIHALNPYGFKYDRRTDEWNVNLNRNFSIDGLVYGLPNEDYRRLRPEFEPSGPVRSDAFGSLGVELQFLGVAVGDGFSSRALNLGLNSGQYQYPQGLNYGGTGPAQQTGFLRQELTPILSRPYRKILFLDLHTGLGDDGVLSIIKGIHPSELLWPDFEAMLGGYDRQGVVIRSGQDPGYFPTAGDVIDFVPALAPKPDRVLAVTMEYGTLGTDPLSELRSASRLILENQAHFHGCTGPGVCDTAEENFRQLFNPSSVSWRLKVLDRADLVFFVLAEKFRASSP